MNKITGCFIALFLWAAALAASAQERLQVLAPAVYAPDAPVAESLRGCNVDGLVASQLVEKLNEHFPGTTGVQQMQGNAGKTVSLTILSLQGAGGGAWSGAKSVTLRADIVLGGTKVASQTFVRNSRGGVLGGVSGSCPIVEKIAATLAADVAAWVARGAGVAAAADNGSKLLVQMPALLDPGVQIKQAIRQDCDVPAKFALLAFDRVGKRRQDVLQVENPDPAAAGTILRLTIVKFSVEGIGEAMEGQTVAVRADMLRESKVQTSRVFERGGASFAIGGTTCEYVERIAQRVGDDVAKWIWKEGARWGSQ